MNEPIPEPAEARIFAARKMITMSSVSCRAFATVGDRIAALGSLPELQHRYPNAEVADFGNAIVTPGFNDAHLHLITAAEDLLHLDLSRTSAPTRDKAIELLRQAATTAVPGTWIRASRYDDAKMSGGSLSRALLDDVTRDHPVLVVHIAGHWAVANSRALSLAGIDESSDAGSGGGFGRDADGRLNGLVYERALQRFRRTAQHDDARLIAPSGTKELLVGLDRAQQMFHAAGLTSVTDANIDPAGLGLLDEAQRQDRLTLRTNVLLQYEFFGELRDFRTADEGHLRLAGVKAMVDGAIGGRTCMLEEPYEASVDDRGIQRLSRDELARIIRDVLGAGWRLCVHANGDRAIRMLLAELDRVGTLCRPEARHRIEHCSLITQDIVHGMRKLGLVAVPFAGYARYHGRKLIEWYGHERVERMFAHRAFLDAGIPVAGSSDFPCGPYEPLIGMASCVTREGEDGTEVGPSQRVSATEALALFTSGASYATAEEGTKGRIVQGQYADFVVLGEDPLEIAPRALGAIPVLATYVGARRVWAVDR